MSTPIFSAKSDAKNQMCFQQVAAHCLTSQRLCPRRAVYFFFGFFAGLPMDILGTDFVDQTFTLLTLPKNPIVPSPCLIVSAGSSAHRVSGDAAAAPCIYSQRMTENMFLSSCMQLAQAAPEHQAMCWPSYGALGGSQGAGMMLKAIPRNQGESRRDRRYAPITTSLRHLLASRPDTAERIGPPFLFLTRRPSGGRVGSA